MLPAVATQEDHKLSLDCSQNLGLNYNVYGLGFVENYCLDRFLPIKSQGKHGTIMSFFVIFLYYYM